MDTALLIRALEGLEPSQSGRCPAHTMTLSDPRPGRRQLRRWRRNLRPLRASPDYPESPFRRAVPNYPGGSRQVLVSVASLSHAAFPVSQPGRHPRLHFRGLLRLHSRYGLSDCSTAQGGLCRKASARPVAPPSRSPATRSNRQLSGWNPPPLVIRAVGPHCDIRVRRYGFCGDPQ